MNKTLRGLSDILLRNGWDWALMITISTLRVAFFTYIVGRTLIATRLPHLLPQLSQVPPSSITIYTALICCSYIAFFLLMQRRILKLWPDDAAVDSNKVRSIKARAFKNPQCAHIFKRLILLDMVFVAYSSFTIAHPTSFGLIGFTLPLLGVMMLNTFRPVIAILCATFAVLCIRGYTLAIIFRNQPDQSTSIEIPSRSSIVIIAQSALPVTGALALSMIPLYILRKIVAAHRRTTQDFQQLTNALQIKNATLEKHQRDLQDQERLHSTIMNAFPFGVYAKGITRSFTYVSQTLARSLGKRDSEMINKSDEDFFPPDIVESYYRPGDEAVLSGAKAKLEQFEPHYIEEYRGLRYLYTIKVPLKNDANEIIGLVGISGDPTEFTFFGKLPELIPYAIFWKQMDGKFFYVNEQFCKAVGKSRKEIINKTDLEVFSHDESLAREFMNSDRKVIDKFNSDPQQILEEFPYRTGKRIQIKTIKTAVKDANGDIIGILGLFIDLRDARREGEGWLRWLLHDLPKPLAIIRDHCLVSIECALDAMESKSMGEDSASSILYKTQFNLPETSPHEIIVSEIRKSEKLLGLMYTQLATLGGMFATSSDTRFIWQPLEKAKSAKDELAWLVDIMKRDFGGKLKFSCIPNDLVLRSDFGKLRVVLWILLENALKATQEKGVQERSIKTIADWRAAIDISLQIEGQFMHLRVKDNGIGIPRRFRQRVLEGGVSLFKQGAGRGLQIVNHIAAISKGSLVAEEPTTRPWATCIKFSCPI